MKRVRVSKGFEGVNKNSICIPFGVDEDSVDISM